MIRALIITAAIAALPGCNDASVRAPTSESVAGEPAPTFATAQSTLDALRHAELPITNVVEVTEATDDNQLLGRPGQYTSKLFFYDGRHPKSGGVDEGQNTIEAFANAEDAKRRHDYVAEITKGVPMLTQYQVLQGNVLLRLDKVLLPSQAEQYRKVLAGS